MTRSGPLSGLRIVEMEGIGPAPFCGMLLADMGADVLRIDRPGESGLGVSIEPRFDVAGRGRRSLAVDVKSPAGAALVLDLAGRADALIEGFRPGVMERLGLGPDVCLERNPRLVYGRMTGWGQDGPLAPVAGHDIDYIALTGALHAIGRPGERPVPPLNLVGDYGGGAMYLAVGVLAALVNVQRGGAGQVVDAAMVDGAASLLSIFFGMRGQGLWRDQRGVNMLDGGAPWYDTYEAADGRHIAFGAIEPKFYAAFLARAGVDASDWPKQYDARRWPELRERLVSLFRTRTRDEWAALMADTDACLAPVLSLDEAPQHPHLRARRTFVEVAGVTQPAPAPRFSVTPSAVQGPAPQRGEGGVAALADWGFAAETIAELQRTGAIA